jgi:sulfide:quinone oxidoreductase
MVGGSALLKAFMKMFKINFVTDAEIEKITQDTVILKSGQKLPFKYSMIIPPFNGAKFVKASGDLGDDKGFIPTHDTYQHKKYPNIFAAGLAVQFPAPWKSKVPMGVPKTGYPSDETAKIAAHNIAHLIKGETKLEEKSMGKIPGLCVMDAGRKEVIIVTNHLLKPRQFAIMIPNPFYDVTKLILEKYFLWKTRTGKSYLI